MPISKYDILTSYSSLAEKADTDRVQGAHWTLGSRIRRHFTPLQLESAELFPDRPEFCGIDQKIRNYISQFYPEEGQNLTDHHTYRVGYVEQSFSSLKANQRALKVNVFQLIYLQYCSLVNWTTQRNLLRCNPRWQNNGNSRYDTCLLNMDSGNPGYPSAGQLRSLLVVTLESGRSFQLALVNLFQPQLKPRVKPRTVWKGCRMYKRTDNYNLIGLDYIVRGSLMPSAFGLKDPKLYYLHDTVDEDSILRLNNIQ